MKPWLDKSLPIDKRVDLLLAEMTLEEKIGQMHQVHQHKGWDESLVAKGLVGSLFNASGPDAGNVRDEGVNVRFVNALQRAAVEQSRLGIPLLFARDVIHGHRTVFPIPLGQAATWNPTLVRDAAAVTASEAWAEGIRWTFTPMMDVSRDPRWGRIAESFGEDPCLAAAMARAAVQGYQGDDLSAPGRIAACAKHFAGYGGAEGGRDYWEVHCGEREMRDVYLPPFRAAVEAGVATLMSGFHVNDGVPASADRHLLTDILKGEWGFEGFVVSDYGIVSEMHTGHGVCESLRDAAAMAANAGLDMDMMAGAFVKHLAGLVADGTVSQARVDDAVRRILRVKFRCGLFEQPYTDEGLAASAMLTPAAKELATVAATESMVLLKNNGILPLKRQGSILLTGPLSRARAELFGCWTLDGRAEDVVPVCDALTAAAGKDVRVDVDNPTAFGDLTPILARKADVVVACVGEAPWRSGEGNSIANLDLPAGQMELLQAVHAMGKPLVAVVFGGRPLAISWLAEHADAIIYAWHPGVAGGTALAQVLFGDRSPGGRLPVSVPRCTGQVPVHYCHRPTHRPGTYWETSGWYKDILHTPLYPFGFGLDYTSFAYADLAVSPAETGLQGSVEVSVKVTNTGARPGSEVVQLYIRDLKASVSRPVKELKAFRKLRLAAGETQRVSFALRAADLAFSGPDFKPVVEPGEFKLWVGPNSAEGLEGAFRLV
jgi:beta-glucosidase